MLDPDGFAFDLGEDEDERPAEDLSEVFSVPGLPLLPALKPRFAPGESQRVLRPLWHSQPEPGLVEALQSVCESYTPPPVSVEVPVTRRSRKRRAARG